MAVASSEHLMIIFGAGASHDAIPQPLADAYMAAVYGGRYVKFGWFQPPLARDLFSSQPEFDESVGLYGAAGALIRDRLRPWVQDGRDLEELLDTISNDAPGSRTVRRELAALRLYLRRVLWRCGTEWSKAAPAQSNYHVVLQRAVRWQERHGHAKISVVTFNYDLLLDNAVSAHPGIALDSLEAYVANEEFRVFKPHGSVNWARIIDEPIPSGDPIAALINLAGDDPQGSPARGAFCIVPNWDSYVWSAPGAGPTGLAFPLITVPIRSKDNFEFPSDHEEKLKKAILDVTRLLVIGWRGTEQNFLALWKDEPRISRPNVHVVSKTEDTATLTGTNLRKAGVSAATRIRTFAGGFTGYLGSSALDEFLPQPS